MPAFALRALCAFLPVLALATPLTAARADQVLLADDFAGAGLNTSLWGLATWNIGDRTQFGNQPQFAIEGGDTYIRLPLDTWNPAAPGQRVLGTEIYSLQNFEPDPGGIEFLARARLDETQGGLVAAFFTYNQRRSKGRWLSDEIDFEVLSKWPAEVLVTSWDDWGSPGSNYEDGVHHRGAMLAPGAFDWSQWNEYAMRWYPDRVEWWINGSKVWEQASPVPDLAQPARASLWAAGSTWPDAYDASLEPTASAAENERYYWDVDFILVTRLGGGGDPGLPQPPTGLSAEVNGGEVRLSWSDAVNIAADYKVYRAWKPKGRASPDFAHIATVPAGTFTYSDPVQDGQYLYQVTAVTAGGESSASNTIDVTVGSGGKGKPRG